MYIYIYIASMSVKSTIGIRKHAKASMKSSLSPDTLGNPNRSNQLYRQGLVTIEQYGFSVS